MKLFIAVILSEGGGYRVIYFEEARIGSKLPNEIYFLMVKKETVKYLQELKKHAERKWY